MPVFLVPAITHNTVKIRAIIDFMNPAIFSSVWLLPGRGGA